MITFRHGDNITELLETDKDALRKMYLNEMTIQYKKWKAANLEITSNSHEDLRKKIYLYSEYREFLFTKKFREENTFLKQRKLFETAFSEFLYYVMKDLKIIEEMGLHFGRADVPLNLKFEYEKLENFKKKICLIFQTRKCEWL